MVNNSIEIFKITKTFKHCADSLLVLRGVDAIFKGAQSYAITGISGSGKSTLLQIIAGFDEPSEGNVFFNNRLIRTFSAVEKEYYVQRVIGFLFQRAYLIKELSVIENIMLPAQIVGDSYSNAYKRAGELLDVVNLASYADGKPGVLSGGQQQRVSLARALCNKPLFLCADEPTASLDAHNRDEIVMLMQYGMHMWGMGVIVCTHDKIVADAMQHQLVLQDGVLQQLVL